MSKIKAITRFVKDAVISFIYWTTVLTPYMVFVVKTSPYQYVAWLGMQAVLIPILGALFLALIRKLKL